MGNVLVNDAYLYGIADAIREKYDTEKKYLPSEMEDAVRGIESGSGLDLSKYFFDLENGFRSADFGDNFVLKLQLDRLNNGTGKNSLRDAFTGMNANKIILKSVQREIICSLINTFSNSTLQEIDISDFDLSITNGTNSFRNCKKLERINGVIKFHETFQITTNMFYDCSALMEVRFVMETIPISISFAQSPNLSATSIQSIIEGLATVETSQTITFHADVKAKLTEAQISQITSKNWTLA